MEQMNQRKRARVDTDDSGSLKRIRDDLLTLLDDSETVPDRDSLSRDLDSVIRSFEEEIAGSPDPNPGSIVDLTADTDEPFSVGELARDSSELVGIGELWEFKDEFALGYDYDPFVFGPDCYGDGVVNGEVEKQSSGNEFVTLDGLFEFDYPNASFGSDFSWQSETLPAL